ncbi:MAG: O-antigen ligase family protein [Verrucomicrobiota bacterium]|jgi:O-antigen ligase
MTSPSQSPLFRVLWWGLGLLLLLLPLRFGNPENPNFAPTPYGDPVVALLGPWPVEWVYALVFLLGLGLLVHIGLPRSGTRWRLSAVDAALFLWFLLPLLTGWAFSEYRYVTVRFLLLSGSGLVCWVLGRWAGRDQTRYGLLMLLVWVAILFTCWSAIEQRMGGIEATRRFVLQQYGGDWANVPEVLAGKLSSNRVYGPFLNPNLLTGFLLAAFAGSVGPGLAVLRKRFPGVGGLRWIPLALGLLVGCTLVFAESKAGWIALLGGIAWALLWSVPPRRRRPVFGMVALAGSVGLFGLWMWGEPLLQKAVRTWDARMGYWRGALELMRQNPMTGVGPGGFSIAYPRVMLPGNEETQTAHNFWMQSAADSGFPGLLTAVFLTVVVLVATAMLLRSAGQNRECCGGPMGLITACVGLTSWWLHNLADFHWFVPGDAFLALWMTGWLMGYVPWPNRLEWRIPARWAWGGGVVLTVCGLLSAAMLIKAELHFRGAVALYPTSSHACEQALDKAIGYGLGNAEAYRLRARVRSLLGRLDSAYADYLRILDLVPTRAAYHAEMGNFLREYGKELGRDSDASVRHLQEAVRLYPNKSEYNARLGEALIEEGFEAPGMEYIERARLLKEMEP